MQWTGLNELREKYLSFFESKGHLRLDSFPLVPKTGWREMIPTGAPYSRGRSLWTVVCAFLTPSLPSVIILHSAKQT